MTGFTNGLSPAQSERLALLAEEMGEAIQVIGKILRHGYDSRNPLKHDAVTNRWLLEGELGHVLAAMCLLQESGDLSTEAISDLRDLKLKTVSRWLHHQPSPSPASDESTGDTA